MIFPEFPLGCRLSVVTGMAEGLSVAFIQQGATVLDLHNMIDNSSDLDPTFGLALFT